MQAAIDEEVNIALSSCFSLAVRAEQCSAANAVFAEHRLHRPFIPCQGGRALARLPSFGPGHHHHDGGQHAFRKLHAAGVRALGPVQLGGRRAELLHLCGVQRFDLGHRPCQRRPGLGVHHPGLGRSLAGRGAVLRSGGAPLAAVQTNLKLKREGERPCFLV